MFAWGLAVIMLVAGCDGLFGLDHVNNRGDGTLPDDALVADSDGAPMPDGPNPHLVVRFDFEGTLLETKSGLSATCITGNGCPAFKTAVHGMGIELDGMNDCLQFSLPANPLKITVAFWVRKPDDGASVVAKPLGTGGANTFQVDTEPSRIVRFHTNNGTATDSLVNPGVLAVGVWTHIAATFDGGTKRLFIDGTAAPNSMPANGMAWDLQPFLIGCDRDSGTYVRFLSGMVDELIIYDVALTPAEIAALAQP